MLLLGALLLLFILALLLLLLRLRLLLFLLFLLFVALLRLLLLLLLLLGVGRYAHPTQQHRADDSRHQHPVQDPNLHGTPPW